MADIKVYTLNEVAEILKLSKRTLYNYINAGTLEAVKIGKYWRVKEEALEAFLAHDQVSASTGKESNS